MREDIPQIEMRPLRELTPSSQLSHYGPLSTSFVPIQRPCALARSASNPPCAPGIRIDTPTKFRDELFSLTNSIPHLLNYPPCATSLTPIHTPAAIKIEDTAQHRAASPPENDLPNSLARKSKPAPSKSSTKHRKAGDANNYFFAPPRKNPGILAPVFHFPHHTGLRFSRNAPIPSCASIAVAFWLITSFV